MRQSWWKRVGATFLVAGVTLAATAPLGADEGMWTFDNPPVERLRERYGFTPTPEWLDHVRLASVRFNDGGSGSFVSPQGLVLTNHHVARGQLQKLSGPGEDYVKDGFLARTRAEEARAPDLELNVLLSLEDVTSRVQAAVRPGMSDEEGLEARKARIAAIEKQSLEETDLRSDVVTLYHGGEYWLYRYKKYTDIRLVFAPEVSVAFFGGDPDNFTYPRYCLDMALFRVYEDGQPVESPAYLRWDPEGVKEGDLVFVTGHPGSTARLQTVAQLAKSRDHVLPRRLAGIERTLGVLARYSRRGVEQARQAQGMIFGLRNGQKAMNGMLAGLQDEEIWAKKVEDEERFRARVQADPELRREYGSAWAELESAQRTLLARFDEHWYRRVPGHELPGLALRVFRYVTETVKPDGERMDGYHDAQLESLRFRLFSPAPIYPELEVVLLADELEKIRDALGRDDPYVRACLQGRAPAAQARRLIEGTALADPAVRRALVEGGPAAVRGSDDPLLVWARGIAPISREMYDWYEDEVESVESRAGEKLGAARFAVYGKSTYPDATFTLRLAYGAVEGYPMNGTKAPPLTTYHGFYDRAYGFGMQAPFRPPGRWRLRRSRLDLSTPFNFVSSCDIIGGNSGSPVIDREGELVGLIFDGNIESLVGRYVYDGRSNRAVSVHSAGMLEAMRKVYDADFLVREILAGR